MLYIYPYIHVKLTFILRQIIRKPVDIAKIQKRIEEFSYEDMNALEKVCVCILLYLFTLSLDLVVKLMIHFYRTSC